MGTRCRPGKSNRPLWRPNRGDPPTPNHGDYEQRAHLPADSPATAESARTTSSGGLLGYNGRVGCEYNPIADTLAGLAWPRATASDPAYANAFEDRRRELLP